MAAVSVASDLTEIRLESEQAIREIVDHHVDPAIDGAVDATIDRFADEPNADPEALKVALKRALRLAIKRPLKPALYEIVWAVIQAVLSSDKLGVGINLLFRSLRDLLATPEGLRDRAERAEEIGNEDKARELRARADRLEEARRGNDR